MHWSHFDGSEQNCGNSIVFAMVLLQSCDKTSISSKSNDTEIIYQWLSARLWCPQCLSNGDIKNNAWVTVNNDFLSQVRRFGNDFHEWRSHEWKSFPNRLTNDKKSFFTVTNVLFYFLHATLCHEHTNPLRTIIERSFRHCCQGRPFLTEHCDVTTIDLWRHGNVKYWYCDVIFVYCHCTRKLAQRRSSLVNNSREYRYLATRYSRLSV